MNISEIDFNLEEEIIKEEMMLGWDGPGHCRRRHIHESNDWCNNPVVKGGKYCRDCTCIVKGCVEKWEALYPMLPGSPRFCGKHHNEKYAGPYGCDFSGPDDFDPPW